MDEFFYKKIQVFNFMIFLKEIMIVLFEGLKSLIS